MRLHRWVRRVWVTLGLGATAAMVWNVQEHGVPAAMFESNANVTIARTEYGRTFTPARPDADLPPVIFLPGGLIDPDAYIPLVRGLAESGVAAALVELPFRAAPTAGMQATLWARIEQARGSIAAGKPVALAGHSRGAMFAAVFAAEHPSALAALVLIGTTHPRDQDLSWAPWPVLKVMGSADCVASPDAARANASMLPPGTEWLEIAGGNHRQFGYYGWQLGDCGAAISRQQQHQQAISGIVRFLRTRAPLAP